MDLRKIKLDLTVALMNNPQTSNAPGILRERLQSFAEVGRFLGMRESRKKIPNRDFDEYNYLIRFENLILDLRTVFNQRDLSQVVNDFSLSRRTA